MEDHLQTSKENEFIWHYTPVENLCQFMKDDATLYATHSFFLNDENETCLSCNADFELFKLCYCGGNFSESNIRNFELQKEKLGFIRPRFLFCFTKKQDDLSQWRAYTPRGGYAIGFNRRELEANLDYADDPDIYARFSDCEYLTHEDEREFRETLKSNFDEIENFIRSANSRGFQVFFKKEKELYELTKKALLYKNDHFKSEDEVRLVFMFKKALCGKYENIEFIGGKPRIPIRLKTNISKLIRKIIVSPHGDKKRNAILAELLVRKFRCKPEEEGVPVTLSKIPSFWSS